MTNGSKSKNIVGSDQDDNLKDTGKSDQIDAGKGNDFVRAKGGDDVGEAGLGNDVVLGGAGKDTLIGDAPGEYMFKGDLVTMAEDQQITVTFDFEGAGYKNTLGVYKVDPDTGAFKDVEIMWENASLKGSGGDLVGGKSEFTYDVAAGDQVGFYLVGNGFNKNDFSKLDDGSFGFVNSKTGAANSVDGSDMQMIHTSDGGQVTKISGSVFHTAGFGDRAKLNPDGIEHTIGYKKGDDGTIQLGFEDLYNGGDRDFDDAVFTVDIGKASVELLNKHYETELQEATKQQTQARGAIWMPISPTTGWRAEMTPTRSTACRAMICWRVAVRVLNGNL
jgi:serralysin